MSEHTLLLVDGSSYLFRAFHALPDLRTRAGEPTGAIRGVVSMLRRLRADRKLVGDVRYAAVVFDAPGRTFRDDLYDRYKANRAETPPDLVAQIEPIHRMVRAMGWPLVMIEGIEADDVIGTLTERAWRRGLRSVVSTGDKDLAQLVNPHVTLVDTMTRGGEAPQPLDRDGVIAKFGVPPERIVDWLTLVGDTVDNVPGVAKVGPKTAVKWLTEYGSLEAVIAVADRIGGVVGENLRGALGWLPTARQLVTIRTDCELAPQVASIEESLLLQPEDTGQLRELFERYEMRSLLGDARDPAGGRVAGAGAGGPPADGLGGGRAAAVATGVAGGAATEVAGAAAPPAPEYECVLDPAALERWIGVIEAAPLVSFDTETTSLDPMAAEIVGLSLSVAPGRACYVPLAHRYAGAPDQLDRETVLARLRGWLESPAHSKVGQNLKYDMHVLANHGIALAGIEHDTLLQSYVLEAHRPHNMDALAQRHLERRTVTYEEVAGKGASQIGFEQVSLEQATRYAAEDAEVTMHLHRVLYPRLEAEARLLDVYRRIEMPVMPVLQAMERTGVLVDADTLARQSEALGQRMMELERRAHEAAGQPFNLNSPKQLGEILFERLALPVVKKTASGAPSTDEEVLEKLALDYPLPRLVLDYRGCAKLKSTYTDKLPRMVNPHTGRVHTSYSQAVAITGRLSSNEPNLQNIPIRTPEGRRIREAFVAPPDHGPPVGRRGSAAGVRRGAGRAPGDRLRGVRRTARRGQRRAAALREDHQLRADLRDERVRAGGAAGHRARGGAHLDRAVLRPLSRGAPVHGRHARAGQGARLRGDGAGAPAVAARDQLAERPAPRRRRAPGDQRAAAGHGGRHRQARDDRRAALAARGEARLAAGAAGPRRAGARGAAGRAGDDPRRGAAADGRRGRAGGAAAGRGGGRAELGAGALRPARPGAVASRGRGQT